MNRLQRPYVRYSYIYNNLPIHIIIQKQRMKLALVATILVGEAKRFKYFPLLDINTMYFYLLYLATRTQQTIISIL